MLCKNKLGVLLALIFLTGCASTPITEYVVEYKPIHIVCDVPKPETQNMFPIRLEKVLDQKGTWWITTDDDNYKKMGINNARVLKYSKDMLNVNKELRGCIQDNNDKAELD